MNVLKKAFSCYYIIIFFLDISYTTTNQANDSSELNATEITKLANKIRLLQAQIAKLDNQRITDDTVVGLGSQQKVSSDQFNDFDKSTKVR